MKNTIINNISVNGNSALPGENIINVVTHSGIFHSDELASIAMIQIANPGKMINVIRTRKDSRIADLRDMMDRSANNDAMNIMLVDIGREYDETNGRFDHHQDDFDRRWSSADLDTNGFITPGALMASAGLIYNYYYDCGNEEIKNLDFEVIKNIDMNDNGVDTEDVEYDNSLSTWVGKMNVGFEDDAITSDEAFENAAAFMFRILINDIMHNKRKVIAKRIVAEAEEFKGDTLILSEGCNWKGIVNGESEKYGHIRNVIYPKKINDNYTTYNCQKPNIRKKLSAKKFAGKPFHHVDGVQDIFVHKNGFIANLRTIDDAKEFIKKQ